MPTHTPRWPSSLQKARLHFVTGKGGTGKTTLSAALALALSTQGRKVLLVEVEGRQGVAQLFGLPPLPHSPSVLITDHNGGVVEGLAINIEAAFLEYLDLFYSLGLAGKAMKKVGAVEFATTIAPGLRDVLLTGKIKYHVMQKDSQGQPLYDAVVVDAPPTGRITRFLDVTKAISRLAQGGPIHSQAEGVVELLHSEHTVIHLATLLEALPVQETSEAIAELRAMQLPLGSIMINRTIPQYFSPQQLQQASQGIINRDALRQGLSYAGICAQTSDIDGLVTTAADYANQVFLHLQPLAQLEKLSLPQLDIPTIFQGINPSSLQKLAQVLIQQGVR